VVVALVDGLFWLYTRRTTSRWFRGGSIFCPQNGCKLTFQSPKAMRPCGAHRESTMAVNHRLPSLRLMPVSIADNTAASGESPAPAKEIPATQS
jgi:hypothetical protein